ncbi:MAG TPA: tail fiber protein [Myxococcota bacterium]|nr:tail fiber protein [Myxococcota bacterium]
MVRGAVMLVAALAAAWPSVGRAENPYIGEVRSFGYNFCPVGWLPADGRLVAIAENDALFNLIGTTYGGDGQETFGLPDLRGRLPLGTGQGPGLSSRPIGEVGGTEAVTLTTAQLPAHQHVQYATTLAPTSAAATDQLLAQPTRTPIYRSGDAHDTLRAGDALGSAGGSQPVDNLPPYTAFTICMAAYGIYPTSN